MVSCRDKQAATLDFPFRGSESFMFVISIHCINAQNTKSVIGS